MRRPPLRGREADVEQGDQPLPVPSISVMRRALRLHEAVGVAFLLLISVGGPPVLAKAPPFATTVLDVEALTAPALGAPAIAVIPRGTDVELTGAAAPGFLGILYGDQEAWVAEQYLSLGTRPGIDTAVATQDTPLLDAPMHDADVLATVPAGDAVILTGARVDGFDAAAHEGVGGWVNDRHLAR